MRTRLTNANLGHLRAALAAILLLSSCTSTSKLEADALEVYDATLVDARMAADAAADAAPAASVIGFYSGVLASQSSPPGISPMLAVFDLALADATVTGTIETFETYIGIPQRWSGAGVVTGTTLNMAFQHAHPPCPAGATLTVSGQVQAAGIAISYSGNTCDIRYDLGAGFIRRASSRPGAPRFGATGFYSGLWIDFPSPGWASQVAVDLSEADGQISGYLHTYDAASRREIFLPALGRYVNGQIEIDFSSNDPCVTTLRFSGGLSPTLTGVVSGTYCGFDIDELAVEWVVHAS